MKRTNWLLLAVSLLMAAPVLLAASEPAYSGYVFRRGAYNLPYPSNLAPANTILDFCDSPSPLAQCPMTFVTKCINNNGTTECHYYEAASIETLNCGTYWGNPLYQHTWYIRVRDTGDDWGQFGVPIAIGSGVDHCGNGQPAVNVPPSPHKPSVTSPSPGANLYVTSFDIRWMSGIDAVRNSPSWPVTYKVYLKSWDLGTTEPAGQGPLVYSGACPVYGTDQCRINLTNQPSAHYRVNVQVDMDVSAAVPEFPSLWPIVYSKSASTIFTNNTGRPPGCCR